jgi:hypothetical protein
MDPDTVRFLLLGVLPALLILVALFVFAYREVKKGRDERKD